MFKIADVSFSVDVIMNMVNKGFDNNLKNVEAATGSISKNTNNLSAKLTDLGNKAALKQLFTGFDDGAQRASSISKALGIMGGQLQEIDKIQVQPLQAQDTFTKSIEGATKSIAPYQSSLGGATKTLQGYVQELELVNRAFGKGSPQSKAYFNDIVKNTQFTAKEFKNAERNLAGFNFSFLSLIFGGIALQKIFGGAFKTLRDGYLEIADETDLFRKKTENLGDSFTLLKFTVFDAFAQNPIIQKLIDGLSDALVDLADWFERNPTFAVTAVSVAGGLSLLGTALFTLGTAQQLFMAGGSFKALSTALDSIKNFDLNKMAAGIEGVALSFQSGITSAAFLALLPVMILVAGFFAAEFSDSINTFLDKFGAIGDVARIVSNTLGIVFTAARIGFNALVQKSDEFLDVFESMFPKLYLIRKLLEFAGVEIPSLDEFADSTENTLNDMKEFNEQVVEFNNQIDEINDKEVEIISSTTVQDTKDKIAEINKELGLDIGGISDRDLIQGIEVLKDLDVETFKESLDDIKTPLSDFLGSFKGDEGLITALADLLENTQSYVAYVPTLETSFTSEGNAVDALTKKYKALAKAKKDSGSATSSRDDDVETSSRLQNFSSVGGGTTWENPPPRFT